MNKLNCHLLTVVNVKVITLIVIIHVRGIQYVNLYVIQAGFRRARGSGGLSSSSHGCHGNLSIPETRTRGLQTIVL